MALQAFSEDPLRAGRASGPSGWPATPAAGRELVAAYEQALARRARGRRRRCPCWRTLARAYEKELANPEAAIERNRTILQVRCPQRRRRAGPRAPLRRHRAPRRPAGDLRQEADSRQQRGGAPARPAAAGRPVRRRDPRHRAGHRAVPGHPARPAPRTGRPWRALDRLYRGTNQWKELNEIVDRGAGDRPRRSPPGPS